MDMNLDGKKIAAVYWPNSDIEKVVCLRIGHDCDDLYLSATNHGDRSELWIVQIFEGAEVARHNARYVETIVWA